MLTLLEVLSAIKTLDTEPDVIRNACRDFLYGEAKARLDPTDSTSIAQDIALIYGELVEDKRILLTAEIEATAFTAAFLCKPGHEIELLKLMMESLRTSFITIRARKLTSLFARDPATATEQLLTLLRQTQISPKED